MKSRIYATIITSLLLVPFTVQATITQYDKYAEKLATVGVFKGTGNGFELDRAPSRLEGIIMLIRLLGKEDDALTTPITESVFTDVPGWAIQYTNYAFQAGLTKGMGNGVFGSDLAMNADAYYTYLLRALGYDDTKGDFAWNRAVDYAYSLHMMSDEFYSQLKQYPFLRDHVAMSSYYELYEKRKGSSETLLSSLVASGDIDAITASNLLVKNITIIALDKKAESIIIQNNSVDTIDLSGWTVVSVKGNQTFVFPTGTTIAKGQSLKLTSGDAFGTGDFDISNFTIWNNSEQDDAELLDTSGNRIDYWTDTDY